MLPDVLSGDACSLRPGSDRNAVTVEMELHGAEVGKVAFHRSLIRSDARLDYPQVDRVFAGAERAEEPWAEPLALARGVAAELAAGRDSLEVGSSEPSFEFDSDGHVIAVHAEEQTESHGLIEQLMVLANEQVAGYLADRRLPTLYRVHEKPDPTAVAFMVEQLASLEVPTPPLPDQMSPQQAAEAGRRGLAPGGAPTRSAAAAGAGLRHRSSCARSSRPSTRRATSATRAWHRLGTATSPRRFAATRTWSCTVPCSRGSASTTTRRRRTSWTRRAWRPAPRSGTRCRSSATPTTSAWRSCSSAC